MAMGTGPYQSELHFEKEPVRVGEPAKIQIMLRNATTYAPVTVLDTVHERKMHVFIWSENAQYFTHMHPEDFPDGYRNSNEGKYNIAYTFPTTGNYLVLLTYAVDGLQMQQAIPVFSYGNVGTPPIEYNFIRKKQFGNYSVTLEAPEKIYVNQTVDLAYYFRKNGEEVRDLQQYLGTELHIVTMDESWTDIDHLHTYLPGHSFHVGNMTQRYKGPRLPVRHAFTNPGRYVLFAQFMHENKVITTKFMIEVEPEPTISPGSLEAAKNKRIKFTMLTIAGSMALLMFVWMIYDRRKKLL